MFSNLRARISNLISSNPKEVTGTESSTGKMALDVSVKSDSNDRVYTTNPILEASIGGLSGVLRGGFGGHNPSAGTTEVTLWLETTNVVFPSVATVMKVSSTSANDTYIGTGARSILIKGLSSTYDEVEETVALNGITAVNTANAFLRINEIRISEAGSGRTNAGNVYIGVGTVTAGKPATVYNVIGALAGKSRSAFFTIPRNKVMVIDSFLFGPKATKFATISIHTHTSTGLSYRSAELHTTASIHIAHGILSPPVDEKIDIELRAYIDAGSTDIESNISYLLVDKSLVSAESIVNTVDHI